MRNGRIIVGVLCSTLVVGTVIMLTAHGAWGEEKGAAPKQTAPSAEQSTVRANPADSTTEARIRDLAAVWKHHGNHTRPSGSMPEYKPDPGADHKITTIKPDDKTDYQIRIVRPNSGSSTFRSPERDEPAKKVWKSGSESTFPTQSGDEDRSSDTSAPKKK